ncbi:MAG TPA: DUF202 domain-containing protein [Euzebya sp.]|nr:DUF202 domain-containing protein [Euzebya sp.]
MPARVHDGGLQLERTTLAWDRTALAFLANGLLIVRLGGDATWLRGVGFVVVALAAVTLVLGRRRYVSRDRRLRAGSDTADPVMVYVVGLAAVAASFLALLAASTVLLDLG